MNTIVGIFVLAATLYTLPHDIHWLPLTGKNVPAGAHYALLRGNSDDKCGSLVRNRFPNGFVFPWHVNRVPAIYTVLEGTLVIGFDRQHAKSKERALPAGSVMQGLATEPHYGRAIGQTTFDVYVPCGRF